MKLLFDTSTLVASLTRSHPHHSVCRPWLLAVQAARHHGFICTHSLAELYATLTAMPLRPPLSVPEVHQVLEEAVLQHLVPVALDLPDYRAALEIVTRRLLRSGVIFDALVEVAARKACVDRLVTLNISHFNRLSDEPGSWLLDPRHTAPPA
ncbi:MAG: VapC toxin family PIN domain ribonuclease [Armatimonadetes bacterium]|nr:VapC toxin family PIN domain ribonuclease [Armatimonadota bacterium]